jgi:flavorubredoxin
MICPQHGSVFQGEMVTRLLDWLDSLEVGQWTGSTPTHDIPKAA